MARTLVISNADFSENKVATVEFADTPCTGIELDESSISMNHVGDTETLNATVTPADTTDAIIWSTSDPTVATVDGGVVTSVGCGTATITATCGEFSDTCSVTVVHVATISYAINRYFSKSSNKNYLQGGNLDNRAIGFSGTATASGYKISYDDRTFDRYPYLIPNGATNITITCTNFKPYGYWLDSTTLAAAGINTATALTKDEFGDGLSTAGTRTVTIPEKTGDYADLDSVAFVFNYTGGTISDSAMEEITVTFSKVSE